MTSSFPPPPVFSYPGANQAGVERSGIFTLVDVFDEFLFTPAERDFALQNQFIPPQPSNDGLEEYYYDDDSGERCNTDEESGKPKKRIRSSIKELPVQQQSERRERNREHAKKSRVRKKFLLDSLQHSVRALEAENAKLRAAIKEHLKDEADYLLSGCAKGDTGVLIAPDRDLGTRTLDNPDFALVKALQNTEQTFLITDPALPDNPIVYASQGFLKLTGYSLEEVLGRNCRFLQGPETDPRTIERIRNAVDKGEDVTEVILNYRRDGSPFWNQLFVAGLSDADGNIVNFLGVQCLITESYARAYLQKQNANHSKVQEFIKNEY